MKKKQLKWAVELVREIKAACIVIDIFMPEDHEWAQEELGILEDLSRCGLMLSESTSACIKNIQGR